MGVGGVVMVFGNGGALSKRAIRSGAARAVAYFALLLVGGGVATRGWFALLLTLRHYINGDGTSRR